MAGSYHFSMLLPIHGNDLQIKNQNPTLAKGARMEHRRSTDGRPRNIYEPPKNTDPPQRSSHSPGVYFLIAHVNFNRRRSFSREIRLRKKQSISSFRTK